MYTYEMKIPVLLLAYNRPDLLRQQLDFLLTTILCQQIYISIDGPKKNPQDKAKNSTIKKLISDYRSQYPKIIFSQFSGQNLGCQKGVEKGIDWFFSQVKAGIVLEDDCQPHPDFFPYCKNLLKKYQDDERVGMISGTNPLVDSHIPESYFFSRQSIVWGWASWSRAWQDYHQTKDHAPQLLTQPNIEKVVLSSTSPAHLKIIKKVAEGKIDTWDYIWYLTNILQSRYCIIPTQNLVSNLGFSADATHTKIRTTQAALPTHALAFPLRHPSNLLVNLEFEAGYLKMIKRWRLLLSIFKAYLGF